MQFPNHKVRYARHFIAIAILLQGTTSAPRKPRLSIADWGEAYHEHEHEGKGTYAFGYDIDDPKTGNTQFRDEERHANGSVTGSYGLVEPDGNVRVVHYIADANGFRVKIVNSQKPNAEFPPPTPPMAPSETPGQSPQLPEKPSEFAESPSEQPEHNFELPQMPPGPSEQPEHNFELPQMPLGPSEQPEHNFELPQMPPGPLEQPEHNFELPQMPSGPSEKPEQNFEQPELPFGPSEQPEQNFEIPSELPQRPVESSEEQNSVVSPPPNTIVIPGGFVIEIPPDDPEDNSLHGQHGFTHYQVHPMPATTRPPIQMKYVPHHYSQFGPVLFHPHTTAFNGYHQRPFSNYYLPPSYNPYYSYLTHSPYYNSYN